VDIEVSSETFRSAAGPVASCPIRTAPPRRHRWSVWLGLGVAGIVVGGLLAAGAAVDFSRLRALQSRGVMAEALVVGDAGFRGCRVRFEPREGVVVTGLVSRSGGSGSGGRCPLGPIQVVFDPLHPANVRRAGALRPGVPAVLLVVFSLVALAGATALGAGLYGSHHAEPCVPCNAAPLADGTHPPGWYDDPWWPGAWRWWTGQGWTGHTTPDPTPRPAARLGRLAPVGAWYALGGLVVSFLASAAAALLLRAVIPTMVLPRLIVAQFTLWAVLFATCVLFSRRHGSGDWRADYGFEFRLADLWSGFGVLWLALTASVVALLPILNHTALRGSNTRILTEFRHSAPGYTVVAAFAVVGAPIFEELYFRGLLLRSLASRTGTFAAVCAQSLLFGLAHANPAIGAHNATVVVGTAAIGLVLGFAAAHYRRLGPGMAAHGMRNLLSVVFLLTR
jgi:membrane protease YdiL (CAAX protease family)